MGAMLKIHIVIVFMLTIDWPASRTARGRPNPTVVADATRH